MTRSQKRKNGKENLENEISEFDQAVTLPKKMKRSSTFPSASFREDIDLKREGRNSVGLLKENMRNSAKQVRKSHEMNELKSSSDAKQNNPIPSQIIDLTSEESVIIVTDPTPKSNPLPRRKTDSRSNENEIEIEDCLSKSVSCKSKKICSGSNSVETILFLRLDEWRCVAMAGDNWISTI